VRRPLLAPLFAEECGLAQPGPSQHDREIADIQLRYARRAEAGLEVAYNPVAPCNAMWKAELHAQAALLLHQWLGRQRKLSDCVIAEIGCGSGSNLLDMIGYGAEPTRLHANELLPERMAKARHRLPRGVTFHPGDAMDAAIAPGTVDLVLQFTVLSSILDPGTRRAISQRIWSWLKPGGAILSYDFIYNNPRNPDVRKVSVAELGALFPNAALRVRRVTLAPPLARRIAPISPLLFRTLSLLPPLRTHALCLIPRE